MQSNVGCKMYEDKIPIDKTTYQIARDFGIDPTVCALSGGEDYELLFTIAQADYEKLKGHLLVTVIGHMTDAGEGMMLVDKSGGLHPLSAQGWDAFKSEDPEETSPSH